MAKTASQIVARALTLVDEEVTEFIEAASTETSMREIGLEVLPEVCRNLVKELPYELKRLLAKSSSIAVDSLASGEDQSAYVKQKVAITLPADFWELVAVRMTVWAKPATSYITVDSEEYSKQNNPFTRAGKQNPVVAYSNASSDSVARLELFSINDGDSDNIAVFEYVSFDNVPDDSGNTWDDKLFDEVTKALASEFNLIKGRLQEGALRASQAEAAVEQHQ